MLAICNESCNEKFQVKELKENKIKCDIREVYFKCPHCNKKYTCFYTDKSIRQKQAKIRNVKNIDEHEKIKKQIKNEMDNLKIRMLGTQ